MTTDDSFRWEDLPIAVPTFEEYGLCDAVTGRYLRMATEEEFAAWWRQPDGTLPPREFASPEFPGRRLTLVHIPELSRTEAARLNDDRPYPEDLAEFLRVIDEGYR